MSWNSVTEDGSEPSPGVPEAPSGAADAQSDFQFDLSSALQRMGDPRPTGAPVADSSAKPTSPIAPPAPPQTPAAQPPAPPVSVSPPPTLAAPAPLTAPAVPSANPAPPPAPIPAPVASPQPAPPAPQMAAATAVPTTAPETVASAPPAPPAPAADALGVDLPRRLRQDDPTPDPIPDDAALPRRDATAQASAAAPAPTPSTAAYPAAGPTMAGAAPEALAPTVAPAAVSSITDQGSSSVFDSAAPAPALPDFPAAPVPGTMQAPVIPPAMAKSLPSLPTANPVYEPMIAESETAAPDVSAVRSFQARADRQQKKSKMFGRTFFAFVVLAGLVAGALVFGRPLLYPDEWNAELTPYVDLIQNRSGAEFVEPVELNEMAEDAYGSTLLSIEVGNDWSARLAEWRALGIASGSADGESLSAAVAALQPVVYDAATNTIYRSAGATPASLTGAFEVALQEIFLRQQAQPPTAPIEASGTPVLGVTSQHNIATHALDRELSGARSIGAQVTDGMQAPLPLLYELVAIDQLGGALAATATDGELVYGSEYPDVVLDAFAAPTRRSTPAALPEGAEPLAAPESLGLDAWSLVWANRLPADSVDRLNDLVTGDSYRTVRLGGKVCVLATFSTSSEAATTDVMAALARWALAAPAEADAAATQTNLNLVQLITCDPGAGVSQPVNPSVVDDVLARQLARLAP